MTRPSWFAALVVVITAAAPPPTSVAASRSGTPQEPGRPEAKAETAPPTLEQLYEALRAPVITGVLPAPTVLTVGRAEIQPGPGTRLLVMSARGRPCGWLLDGPATVTYRVEDRYSLPVARRTAKAAGGLEFGMDGGVLWIRTKVQGIAAWTWEVDASAAAPVEAGEAALPPWVRDFIDRKLVPQPEVDMVLGARNGERGLAWVVFHGPDDLALRVDPALSQRIEVLWRVRPAPSSDRGSVGDKLIAEEVAAQPIGRAWLDHLEMPFASIETDADVSNPAAHTLRVSARTRVRLLRDGMTVLPMLLWDEVRVKEKLQTYRITKLTADGAAVDWLQRKGYLLVGLPHPMRRDETVTLDLVAEVDLLSDASKPYFHWRLVGAWYPRPVPNARELAEIRVSATVRAPLVPLAGGDIQEQGRVNGVNSVRTRLPGPMESGSVVGGRYKTVVKERAGMHVHVSTLERQRWDEAKAPWLDDNVTHLATTAIAVRQCLEQWLGVPYPFPDLQMIETSFDLDQVPGVIFVNYDDLFLPRQAWGQSGTAHRIAREVAHGWFPHVAKVASSEESWLGESLADYTAAHCLSLFGADPKNGARLFKSRVDEWKEASKSAGDDVSVLLAEHLGVPPTVATTTRAQAAASPIDMPESPSVRHIEHASNTVHGLLLQGRGPLVLHGVRERLVARYGEEKGTSMFLVWIRYYVKNFTYKAASTRVLIELLEKITGESWQAYFEQYLFGTDPLPVK